VKAIRLSLIAAFVLVATPAFAVELFRYRGAAKDGGTLEYVFEAGEQNSPNAVTKEKVAEIAAEAETLRTIAADPKHLGAEMGFFAVLHTWGSNLLHHPHLHCVVHRRWSLCGWHGVGFLPSRIFLTRPGPLPAVSSFIPGISHQSLFPVNSSGRDVPARSRQSRVQSQA
jgi:hypothetical protein